MIKVQCYNSWITFATKEEALEYFRIGAVGSEGAERSRYVDILARINAGEEVIKEEIY
jgi:hypothetical protein